MPCKAVILAAGSGSRLSPLTPSIPKELLPVGGFPAIHHVVYEMAEMGVEDILIVLSEGKGSIRGYFTESIRAKGETALKMCARRASLLGRVRISFKIQKERRGTGDAVLLAQDFAGADDLIVAYSDDLLTLDGIGGEPPLGLLEGEGVSSILTRVVPGREACHYGVVFPEKTEESVMYVSSIREKPQDHPFDEAFVLVGRMRLTKECVAEIARHPLTDSAGITIALNEMASRGRLVATVARSDVYDVGTHEGYARTVRMVTAYDTEI